MSDPSSRRVDELISAPGTRLAALGAHARLLAGLERRLRALLDPTLADHSRVAAYRDGRLVLAADSQGWATRLRYHTEHIRENLTAAGESVREVRVIVVPSVAEPTVEADRRPPAPLSPASAGALESAAGCVGHPPLADALRRLAKNRQEG